jgi:DNA end-binding protein Ku
MARRAYWKGFLRLSLVSCPIALFPATSEREKIRFHQINRKTGDRIRYVKVDAETGKQVDNERIIKGYEKKKGEYIPVEPEELEAVAIESKHTIEIDQFVPRDEIDELYLANPYYIVPDGMPADRLSPLSGTGLKKKAWSESAGSYSQRESIRLRWRRGVKASLA